jgi:hypothetical protein
MITTPRPTRQVVPDPTRDVVLRHQWSAGFRLVADLLADHKSGWGDVHWQVNVTCVRQTELRHPKAPDRGICVRMPRPRLAP